MEKPRIVFFSLDDDGVKTLKQIPRDANLSDLLYEFGAFLRSAGYYVDGYIGVVHDPGLDDYDRWCAKQDGKL